MTETAFDPQAFQNDAFQIVAAPMVLYGGWKRVRVIRRMDHTLEEDIAAAVLDHTAAERKRRRLLQEQWLLGLIDDDTLLAA